MPSLFGDCGLSNEGGLEGAVGDSVAGDCEWLGDEMTVTARWEIHEIADKGGGQRRHLACNPRLPRSPAGPDLALVIANQVAGRLH